MSDARQVNRGVAWAGASQAIIAIADLISQLVVLALWVPADHYGIAMMAFTLHTVLDTAADLGVTASLIARDDHTPERVSTVFWFNVLISGGLFLALLILGPLYGLLMDHPVVGWLLIAYGGKLVFQNIYAIPFAMLRKQLRFGEIAKVRTAAHLGESIARIAFAAAGWTIWCFTLAALVRVVIFGVLIQLRHPFVPKLVFRPREVVDYIKFGLRAGSSQILYHLYTNLDYPIVSYFFGATANGIYHFAYWIVLEPVRTITNVVTDVAFPAFARLRLERERVIAQFVQFTRLNLIGVLPFVVLIALVIPEFLETFSDKKWSDAELAVTADIARILCAVGVLRALGFLGPPLLDALGRPDLTLRYMVFAAIAVPGGFLLSALLLPGLGPIAVAIAWAVMYPLAFAVLGYLVAHTLKLPLRRYLRAVWGIVACALAGFAVGLGLDLALADLGAAPRMAIVAGGATATMVLLLAYWQDVHPKALMRALK